MLLRRALDLRSALSLGIHMDLNAIRADELHTMLILKEEGDRFEREQVPSTL